MAKDLRVTVPVARRKLNEVNELSEVEKLQLYFNLPTGVQKELRESEATIRSEIVEASNWIKTHLQPDQELCLPKHEVYEEYLAYCEKHDIKSVGKEDLGKLMRTIYPSVTGRRLGTRGQTKHCYGGLTKKTDLELPLLPKVGAECSQSSTTNLSKTNSNCSEDLTSKKEMVKASCSLICEWAEKLLNQPFKTINDIAEHLVRKSYVNCNSVAAYTVMSQVPKFKEETKPQESTASGRVSTQLPSRPSSSNPRNAKHQLQLKLQEKERWKEQKKKLEEQRCAIAGENPKPDETNSGSADTATVSYEASMSSDNNSNQGNVKLQEIKPIVPKTILPKPSPLNLPTVSLAHPLSGSQQTSSSTKASQVQKQLPVNPLLILSPGQSTGQLGSVFLVSPLNTNQPLILPMPTSNTDANSVEKDNQKANNNIRNEQQESSGCSSVETNGTSNAFTVNVSHNDDNNDQQPVISLGENLQLDTNENCNVLLKALSGNIELHKENETLESALNMTTKQSQFSESNSPGLFQRSQSLPDNLVRATEQVISKLTLVTEHFNKPDSSTNSSDALSLDMDNDNMKRNVKKEHTDQIEQHSSADNSQQSFLWNIPLQVPDADGQTTAIALPVGTIDSNTMSSLGLEMNSQEPIMLSSNNGTPAQSPLQSPQHPLTPGQSVRGLITKKGQSKTVSSLLKEQRVKVENPDLGGKNRYVNDNRPVAQILKELREKKRLQSQNLSTGAMQNLSFAEESPPKEIKEQSVQSLKEKIAREASVMRKVQALSTNPKVTKQGNQRNIVKSEQNGTKSPRVGSPVQRLMRKGSRSDEIGSNNINSLQNRKVKTHQVALRNLLNQRRSTGNVQDQTIGKNSINENVQGPLIDGNNQLERSAYSSKKENAFLKKYLENGLHEKELGKQRNIAKTVCADMNPTLAKLLAENNNDIKGPGNDYKVKAVAGFLQSLNNNSNKQSDLEKLIFKNTSKQNTLYSRQVENNSTSNSLWNMAGSDYTQQNNSGDLSTSEMDKNLSGAEIINMAISQMQENAGQNRNSNLETSTAFMPIQSVSEANTVSPIKPQAVVPNDSSQSHLLSSGTTMNAKLKELLSAAPSDSNDSSDVCSNTDWLPRQNSSFVPYNQNVTNQVGQSAPPIDINTDCFNIGNGQQLTICNEPDVFHQANQFPAKAIRTNITTNSNKNNGFACMDGVRPPSKRLLDPDTQAFLSKRSRHLSDQTNRRSKGSNFIMPPLQPLQPLIQQNRTPSHESLTPMASPASSQGYGQCPAESPFSPEVQAIMSNTNEFYNEFNNPMLANSYRSMSVPVQNFMQNEGGDCAMLGNGNYIPGGNQIGNLQDNSQLGTMPDHGTQYMNMSQQQQQYNNLGYEQDPNSLVDNNSAVYNNAKRNLMQILESRLASANFGEAEQQNLRGDHMISGASVKPTQKMRHKLGETLNSVMIQNPNNTNNIRFCNPPNNVGQQYNMTQPTPPASHPPTPEYSNDLGDNYEQNHLQQQQQQHQQLQQHHHQQSYTVTQAMAGCGMATGTLGTPTSLEAMGSQESRESIADPLFNICDDTGESGADMPDFLRIL